MKAPQSRYDLILSETVLTAAGTGATVCVCVTPVFGLVTLPEGRYCVCLDERPEQVSPL